MSIFETTDLAELSDLAAVKRGSAAATLRQPTVIDQMLSASSSARPSDLRRRINIERLRMPMRVSGVARNRKLLPAVLLDLNGGDRTLPD